MLEREFTRFARIKKIDEDRRIVFGEVYAPNVLDTYREFLTEEDLETMAHRYLRLALEETIDTMHDAIENGSFPVESFIARGHPDYTEGSWVLGIKVPDDHIWRQIKSGELNGFSFEALVKPVAVVAKVFVVRDHPGVTEPPNNDDEGHTHAFYVQLDDAGRVLRGDTSVNEGHSHRILKGTATEFAGDVKHKHRFFL